VPSPLTRLLLLLLLLQWLRCAPMRRRQVDLQTLSDDDAAHRTSDVSPPPPPPPPPSLSPASSPVTAGADAQPPLRPGMECHRRPTPSTTAQPISGDTLTATIAGFLLLLMVVLDPASSLSAAAYVGGRCWIRCGKSFGSIDDMISNA